MNKEQIINAIKSLACSQGFYARLLYRLEWLHDHSEEDYDAIITDLEEQDFTDVIDLIMYFEC